MLALPASWRRVLLFGREELEQECRSYVVTVDDVALRTLKPVTL